jgi:hypothetical protein
MSARTRPAAFDELLDLVAIGVDLHRPADPSVRVVPGVAELDVAGDGLGVAAGQVGRGMGTAGEVEGLEDVHDLPVRLLHGPSGFGRRLGCRTTRGSPTGGAARAVS